MSRTAFAFTRRRFLQATAATAALAAFGSRLAGESPLLGSVQAAPNAAGEETFGYSYCDMCNHGPKCGLKVYLKDGVATRFETRTDYPNDPPCSKGFALLQEEYHPSRLKYPMKRANPKGSS